MASKVALQEAEVLARVRWARKEEVVRKVLVRKAVVPKVTATWAATLAAVANSSARRSRRSPSRESSFHTVNPYRHHHRLRPL